MAVKVDIQFDKEDMLTKVVVQNGRVTKVVAASPDIDQIEDIAKFLIKAFSDVYIESMTKAHNRVIAILMKRKEDDSNNLSG
ncbi:hypothetical protein LCGC14_2557480 [marine sediment metagenome]|uniref:Uncharacterized protein n=1 Tax=marine sediment metagenome TaxID=412755 RepID=A0A0F9ALM6_9ZZZZ